jgi:uncharacterized protein (TIGR03084 family)
MTSGIEATAAALEAEERALDDIVASLDVSGWSRATPAQGWNVRDQIAHLAVSEEWAALAASDPEGFAHFLEGVIGDVGAFGAETEARMRAHDGPNTLEWWRDRRAATLTAVRALPEGTRIPWFGPPMGARSFLTARLMETWAHGQDVRDAFGLEPSVSGRLRDIAHLGVITREFAYANRGGEAPAAAIRIEVVGPDADVWTWGPDDATDAVSGTALDFCLVVTQRRNVADTALEVTGDAATDWMSVVQVFAGPPTDPPPPGRPTLDPSPGPNGF